MFFGIGGQRWVWSEVPLNDSHPTDEKPPSQEAGSPEWSRRRARQAARDEVALLIKRYGADEASTSEQSTDSALLEAVKCAARAAADAEMDAFLAARRARDVNEEADIKARALGPSDTSSHGALAFLQQQWQQWRDDMSTADDGASSHGLWWDRMHARGALYKEKREQQIHTREEELEQVIGVPTHRSVPPSSYRVGETPKYMSARSKPGDPVVAAARKESIEAKIEARKKEDMIRSFREDATLEVAKRVDELDITDVMLTEHGRVQKVTNSRSNSRKIAAGLAGLANAAARPGEREPGEVSPSGIHRSLYTDRLMMAADRFHNQFSRRE